MSNGLPDPDTLLTPGGTPVDAVNGVLNGLNPTANGLNNGANGLIGTPTRKDSGEEGGPGGGQQGGVVKANKGIILSRNPRFPLKPYGFWISWAETRGIVDNQRSIYLMSDLRLTQCRNGFAHSNLTGGIPSHISERYSDCQERVFIDHNSDYKHVPTVLYSEMLRARD